ncbi:hypothetical protein ES332_A02G198200v1 [Gossypium tomentosum]|uniref:Uncharacterized protein n=1 Tax=Gossypium tomentosum TaxID=34277 RepID=A0A5D2RLM5_GOSTO|nr:hypothetical protein ES332_A02G198200v1 [Gossypium tomentosum]
MMVSSACLEWSRFVAGSSSDRAACRHGSTPRDHTDLIIDIFAVDSGLKPLVNEFYDHFKKTIEFCTALKNCLEHARNNHGIIELAVKCYDEEDKLEVGTDEKKSLKSLKEFIVLKGTTRWRQESMQWKMRAWRGTLEKKWESLETWMRVSDALFVAAFISVLVFSAVGAALSVKFVVTALTSVLTVAIVSPWKWCDERWNHNEEKVKNGDVGLLEIKIKSLMRTIDIVLGEEYLLKVAMDEINEKSIHIVKTITDLLWQADYCGRNIRKNWQKILQQMIDYPWEL